MLHRGLRDALENLSYRERRIVELRWGLGDEQTRTLDEVARIFGITRERTRQIEEAAIRNLSRDSGTSRRRLTLLAVGSAPASPAAVGRARPAVSTTANCQLPTC